MAFEDSLEDCSECVQFMPFPAAVHWCGIMTTLVLSQGFVGVIVQPSVGVLKFASKTAGGLGATVDERKGRRARVKAPNVVSAEQKRKEKEILAWRIKDSLYRMRNGRYSEEQYFSHVHIGHKLLVLTTTRIICVTAVNMERRWSIHTRQIQAIQAEFESVDIQYYPNQRSVGKMTLPWVPTRHKKIWCATKDVQDEALQVLKCYLDEFMVNSAEDQGGTSYAEGAMIEERGRGVLSDGPSTGSRNKASSMKGKAKVVEPAHAEPSMRSSSTVQVEEIEEVASTTRARTERSKALCCLVTAAEPALSGYTGELVRGQSKPYTPLHGSRNQASLCLTMPGCLSPTQPKSRSSAAWVSPLVAARASRTCGSAKPISSSCCTFCSSEERCAYVSVQNLGNGARRHAKRSTAAIHRHSPQQCVT
eukprot:scaffold2580_cov388-Prasinococcus_capsulatus_cf.AAC.14